MTRKSIYFLAGPVLSGLVSLLGFFYPILPMWAIGVCIFISLGATIGYISMVVKELKQ
jgi:hypothetical protein